MDRIYFHSTAQTLHRQVDPAPYTNGLPCPAVNTIEDLKPSFSLTGNKGNMVHAEAVLKLLNVNRSRSCVGNLSHLHKALGKGFGEYMRSHFDFVVLSMANFIRKGMNHTGLVAVLKEVDVPLVVFGAGMQTPVQDPGVLHPSTRELLDLLNKKCTLLGVRGEKTSEFMKSLGLHNHKILGCPSLYVYPKNILSIKAAGYSPGCRWATAGHVSYNNLDGSRPGFKRASTFLDCMEGVRPDYVFQDEVFSYADIESRPDVYDDATGRLSAEVINDFFKQRLGLKLPFTDYYWFNEVSQWRQYMMRVDFYLGDRFHGGVAGLQAGVPAIFIAGDQRIDELTDFFGMPKTTFSELKQSGVEAIVEEQCSLEALTVFKTRYRKRLEPFVKAVESAGLSLVNRNQLLAAAV
ncbi:polysaccharide pyruvyl transferase family protein [Marilutibacter aestuarii]|uniref:Polysaccharide pyruvyl transferase family protein n=1 Tax=Marilutibacter aestuarii TaxID=1706195 RepID=A0A507ZQQ3_9GAMM|nr:polysaccharide pyruvyl transferase family protein [Lysobacter aestuarii]TQD38941.1 polysaccharide pyruvyl transferase family protein [Lysobacter aestuarii]